MGRLDNKVAIITGSTGGIGQGIAEMFAQESAKVVISSRNCESGENVVNGIRNAGGKATFIQTDVTKESDCINLIQRTVELYDKIDVFVNNAGIFPRGDILETSEELWDQIMAVNLKGAFFCCKHVIPIMQKQKKGSIINVGSSHAWSGFGNIFAYSCIERRVVDADEESRQRTCQRRHTCQLDHCRMGADTGRKSDAQT